jgi:hypothetical protein
MPVRALFLAILAALSACCAYGQSVVSVRSGLINFVEGEVFLSDVPVEQKSGKFPEVREGAELRTEAGRAEVLLTPGMLLRVGPDSDVRMISASLIDTRVEFRRGSAIIEVSQDPDGTAARVIYRDYEIRFPKRGTFRINSLPREFQVFDGEAEISYLGEKATLAKSQKASLYGGLEAETLRRSISDGLDEWSMRRDNQLAADNPPPGDLNGSGYDSIFAGMPNPYYGIGSSGIAGIGAYAAPVSPYSYGYGYGYNYTPFSTYATYGFSQPYPIYIYLPSRPVVYRPPIGSPIHTPIYTSPRPVFAPRPAVPARPVLVHK